jgi:hypothetical protein
MSPGLGLTTAAHIAQSQVRCQCVNLLLLGCRRAAVVKRLLLLLMMMMMLYVRRSALGQHAGGLQQTGRQQRLCLALLCSRAAHGRVECVATVGFTGSTVTGNAGQPQRVDTACLCSGGRSIAQQLRVFVHAAAAA